MKYKVGDRVRIKSIDWYNTNKDKHGFVDFSTSVFVPGMSQFCGKIVTIEDVFEEEDDVVYCMEGIDYDWTDEMIEGLVKEGMKSEDELLDEYEELTDRAFKGGYEKCKSDIVLNGFQLPEGYIFKDENGNVINATKIVLEKKKKEYPKTYEECCKIMDCAVHPYITANEPGIVSYYEDDLNREVLSFRKLKICRDAYWKLYGEEKGLEEPWESDWTYNGATKYCIGVSENEIQNFSSSVAQYILAFPTEEMRDAFYENFKEDIEFVKELL